MNARCVFATVGAALTMGATMLATSLLSIPAAGAGQVGPSTDGFILLSGDGGIFPFRMPMAGAPASDPTRCVATASRPDGSCASAAVTPSGQGYWILNAVTGHIYPYGNAGSYGEPATRFAGVGSEFVPSFRQLIATPDGHGYWVYEVGLSDLGAVDSFGDAAFFGDTATLAGKTGSAFNGSPVGMAATADGKGYWETRSDGGVFAFGDAKFYGSMGGSHLTRPIVGITATVDGKGYWLVASDGGVFAFGDAAFSGSMGGRPLVQPVVGMVRNPSGRGYWLAAGDGGIFGFGGAPFIGSVEAFGIRLDHPIVAIASKSGAVG